MNMFNKLLLSVITLFILGWVSLGSATTTLAQDIPEGTWYNQGYGEWSQKVFDPSNPGEIFGERYTFAQVTWIVHSLIAILSNPETSKCINLYVARDNGGFKECVQTIKSLADTSSGGGVVGFLAKLGNSLTSTRVASGTEYTLSTASRFHLVPEAYAQGVGFTSIQPIQVLWRAVRNISYSLMTIIFVIMSFAIMFRVRISPQVVISIQSALPRLVLALIFITFSYAIAGFIIDLAYVSLGVISVLLRTTGSDITSLNSVQLFTQLNSGNGIVSISLGFVYFMFIALAVSVVSSITPVGLFVFGGAIIIILILLLILVVILFRLFWTMLRTTLNIILLTIGGPIFIILGILPGAGGIGAWMRSLIANVAVYPTVAVMVFLSHYFFWAWFSHDNTLINLFFGLEPLNTYGINQGAVASQGVNLPGFSFSTDMLGFLAALGILFLIPAAADIVKSFVEGKPFAYGSAIGQAVVGPVVTGINLGTAAGKIGQFYTETFGIRTAPSGTAGGANAAPGNTQSRRQVNLIPSNTP